MLRPIPCLIFDLSAMRVQRLSRCTRTEALCHRKCYCVFVFDLVPKCLRRRCQVVRRDRHQMNLRVAFYRSKFTKRVWRLRFNWCNFRNERPLNLIINEIEPHRMEYACSLRSRLPLRKLGLSKETSFVFIHCDIAEVFFQAPFNDIVWWNKYNINTFLITVLTFC